MLTWSGSHKQVQSDTVVPTDQQQQFSISVQYFKGESKYSRACSSTSTMNATLQQTSARQALHSVMQTAPGDVHPAASVDKQWLPGALCRSPLCWLLHLLFTAAVSPHLCSCLVICEQFLPLSFASFVTQQALTRIADGLLLQVLHL